MLKKRTIKEARQKGHFSFHREKVEIYLNLSSEVITYRWELKIITTQVRQAKQKYIWIGVAKLHMLYEGTALYADNQNSGLTLP